MCVCEWRTHAVVVHLHSAAQLSAGECPLLASLAGGGECKAMIADRERAGGPSEGVPLWPCAQKPPPGRKALICWRIWEERQLRTYIASVCVLLRFCKLSLTFPFPLIGRATKMLRICRHEGVRNDFPQIFCCPSLQKILGFLLFKNTCSKELTKLPFSIMSGRLII